MMRAILCVLLLGAPTLCAAAERSAFRHYKEILPGEVAKDNFIAVTLDSDVYADSRSGFPDLRIFGDEPLEMPYAIVKATESRTRIVRRPCRSSVTALHEHGDNLEILIELDEKSAAADGVSIFTPLTDYERRVTVSGSRDGAQWTPLATGGLVFDYSRYMDIRNGDVRLPKNNFRRLKVSVAGIADARESPYLALTKRFANGRELERLENTTLQRRPFRMDRIELWSEAAEKASEQERKADYPVAQWTVQDDAGEKTTVLEIAARREPLTEFTLKTASQNFSREAVVQTPVARGVHTDWVVLGRATITRVDVGGYQNEKLSLAFPETRAEKYRIVIRNQDNPPLKITDIAAQGNVYQVQFLPAETGQCRLYYGSDEVAAPRYDVATVLGSVDQPNDRLSAAKIGKEIANPTAHAPAFGLRGFFNSPIVWGTAIVALVVLLGGALVRAMRRIDAMPKE